MMEDLSICSAAMLLKPLPVLVVCRTSSWSAVM